MHKEKNKRWYHACYTVHPTTGQAIQEALDSIPGKPFGGPTRISGNGKFIIFNCVGEGEFKSYSELDGFAVDPSDPDFSYAIGLQDDRWHFDQSAANESNGWDARVQVIHTLTDPENFHHCLAKQLVSHPDFVSGA